MVRLVAIWASVALLPACLPYPALAKSGPTSVTVSQLVNQPELFADKQVRVSGQLDECFGWECSLCPQEMTSETADPKQCLPVEFRALIPDTGFGVDEQEALFRFSDVTLVAQFDPSCRFEPCLDRQVELFDAQMVKIGKQRMSKTGLWLTGRRRLLPLPEAESAKVIEAGYKSGFWSSPSKEQSNPEIEKAFAQAGFDTVTRVYGIASDPDTAVACSMIGFMDEPDAWPDSFEAALYAPAKNEAYRCLSFRRIEGAWFAQTNP